jgi:hypothetical protein
MFKYLRFPFNISMWVVTLTTGPLSLLREALLMVDPIRFHTSATFGRSLFFAFIISALVLLIMEHRKVKELEKQLKNAEPNLTADFNVSAVAPAGENDEDAIVAISAHITNTGGPSIVKNIGVLVERGEKSLQGQFITLDYRGSQFQEIVDGQPVVHTVKFEDHLVRNCSSQPIVTGGGITGAHVVLVPNINSNDIYQEGTVVIFSFQDVYGKRYEFKQTMSGQIMPPLNPMMLQKHKA